MRPSMLPLTESTRFTCLASVDRVTTSVIFSYRSSSFVLGSSSFGLSFSRCFSISFVIACEIWMSIFASCSSKASNWGLIDSREAPFFLVSAIRAFLRSVISNFCFIKFWMKSLVLFAGERMKESFLSVSSLRVTPALLAALRLIW